MSAPYTLVEPCAGSAALTLHLLGARRAILPYQGSKWRVRRDLAGIAWRLGFGGPPTRVELTDPGPWGRVLGVVLDPARLPLVVDALARYQDTDPRALYDSLAGHAVPVGDIDYAREFLFLQRLSFSGKAVGERGLAWLTPGFNRTSAYGTPATDRFGAVAPMLPSLVRVLDSYRAFVGVPVKARQTRAHAPAGRVDGPTLVYIDPPYEGLTGYPDGAMSRDEVVDLAWAWRRAGASVMVSEQCWVQHSRFPTWAHCIQVEREGVDAPFRGRQAEWVSFAGPL